MPTERKNSFEFFRGVGGPVHLRTFPDLYPRVLTRLFFVRARKRSRRLFEAAAPPIAWRARTSRDRVANMVPANKASSRGAVPWPQKKLCVSVPNSVLIGATYPPRSALMSTQSGPPAIAGGQLGGYADGIRDERAPGPDSAVRSTFPDKKIFGTLLSFFGSWIYIYIYEDIKVYPTTTGKPRGSAKG